MTLFISQNRCFIEKTTPIQKHYAFNWKRTIVCDVSNTISLPSHNTVGLNMKTCTSVIRRLIKKTTCWHLTGRGDSYTNVSKSSNR